MTEPSPRPDPSPDPSIDPGLVARLVADAQPYLSCDDCFEQLDVHVERTMADPAYADPAMAGHLATCGACAEEAEALRELLAADADA